MTAPSGSGRRPRPWQAWARRAVLRRLAGIRAGRIVLRDAGGPGVTVLGRADGAAPSASVTVLDPRFYTAVARRGTVGAAEAWVAGHWTCDDLVGLVRIMLANRAVLDGVEGGLARLSAPLSRLLHAANANTRRGSRRNISAHYDLGNDFFAAFLDETMTYSAGLFETPAATMAEASLAKIDRLCRKLDLRPSDHLLEIGTGWGSLAIHAASRYGCRVTTTTISRRQHELAVERVRAAGLAGRVEVLMEDYRDLRGTHDKLVSVEMIEAVGHRFLDTYLGQCSRLLAPAGVMALQVITIADQHYERAVREVDFIKRHVFPGSFIPSVAAVAGSVARATDLRIVHLEDFGTHYARTLRQWRRRLDENAGSLDPRYDERLRRLWQFYLAYCEGGFTERFLGVAQVLMVKPAWRGRPILPRLDQTPDAVPAGVPVDGGTPR